MLVPKRGAEPSRKPRLAALELAQTVTPSQYTARGPAPSSAPTDQGAARNTSPTNESGSKRDPTSSATPFFLACVLVRSLRSRHMSDENKEKALEIVKDGLSDLNDAVAALQIPGVSTLYSVGAWVAHRWEVGMFDAFLQRLRARLDLDREQLLREMHDNKDKRWMAEGLARGWRLSLEAMDETARECAYFMVADYMAEKKAPDRLHRQISTFLTEADKPILKLARRISTAKMEIGGRWAAVTRSVMRESEEQVFDIQGGREHYKHLEDIGDPEQLQSACDLLVRAGFMTVWFSHMEMPHSCEGMAVQKVYAQVDHFQAESWKSLHLYLKPVDAA